MFHGKHQPGITTALQARGHLVAFDLAAGAGRKEAAALLRRWSTTAQRLMAGEAAAQDDTDVARDAGPSSLTVTFGFGNSFFARTGLEKQRPVALDPLPDFSSDHLDKARSNGDLWVQIGADDALVAFHALHAPEDAGSAARVRWQMNGFNRSPGATAQPMTARNLMGQIDGTRNPSRPSPTSTGASSCRPPGDPAWMANGSYAVVRRIRMLLDDWEKLSVKAQEDVVGRRKSTGAPLTGGTETTPDQPRQDRRRRQPGRPPQRARPDHPAHDERRRRDAAPPVLLPRRLRPGRGARRGPALRLLAGGSAARFRPGAAQARPRRRPVDLHPPRGERAVRGAGWCGGGRVRGATAAGRVIRGGRGPLG